MLGIYADAKAIGYNAARFVQMVDEMGGLRAARDLINRAQPSEGFTHLWELKRLDLAVESRALKPEFRSLFSAAERDLCRKRLADYGWNREPPWQEF